MTRRSVTNTRTSRNGIRSGGETQKKLGAMKLLVQVIESVTFIYFIYFIERLLVESDAGTHPRSVVLSCYSVIVRFGYECSVAFHIERHGQTTLELVICSSRVGSQATHAKQR